MRAFLAVTSALACAALVVAATQTIDGKDLDEIAYPAALTAQDTQTQFGDNQNELNRMFVDADSDNIYVALSGNLADDNALHLFIDVDGGTGSETLSTDDGSCPQLVRPVALAMLSNTEFDTGFKPDYALTLSAGIFPGQSTSLVVFTADLTDLGTLDTEVLGIGVIDSGNGILTGDSGAEVAIDNSNTLGVEDYGLDPNDGGLTDPNKPPTADTGIEISIPRSLIGVNDARDIRLFAYITNNVQDTSGPTNCPDPNDPNDPNAVVPQEAGPCGRFGYGSNQALPGLGGNANLATFTPGGCFLIDFTGPQGPGTQWITASIPAP